MFQSLSNLNDQVNSGLYYGNPDFNFNVEAEKNPAEFMLYVTLCPF